MSRLVVVGLGLTGDAVVRWAVDGGHDAVVVEDRPDALDADRAAVARSHGVTVVATPTDPAAVADLLAGVDQIGRAHV